MTFLKSMLIFATLLLITFSISGSPVQTKSQSDPFTSQGGLAEVNTTIVVYPSLGQFQMKLSYYGGDDPIVGDRFIFPLNFELLQVVSSISTIEINTQILNDSSQIDIVLNFSRPLFSAEKMDLTIRGRYLFSSTTNLNESIWWNYTRLIGFHQVKILLFNGIDLVQTNPSPSLISREQDFLTLYWNELIPTGFFVNLSAIVTEKAKNELFVNPTSIKVTVTSKAVSIPLQLGNVGLQGVFVSIDPPDFLILEEQTLAILPFTIRTIDLKIQPSQGSQQGTLELETNKSTVPIQVQITVNVIFEEKTSVIQLFGTAFIILVLAGLAYSIQRKQLSNTSVKAVPLDTINLDERQAKILQVISENPGCSQQLVADKLQISKATASREITKLENLGYLKKEREGMSYRLFLTS